MQTNDLASLRQKLAAASQDATLRFYDRLSPTSQEKLAAQLNSIDLATLPKLISEYVTAKPDLQLPKEIRPVKTYPRAPRSEEHRALYELAKARGLDLLKQGKIGAFLVAGGQGTRLGYDGPKGEYPVTPIKNKPLFEVFAEQLLAHSRDSGKPVAWYIMTSEVNDAPTRDFFRKNAHFGYSPDNIFFFQQGMMPAFAMDGQMLLADRDSLALSADGHGGSLRALDRTGALADMRKRGIEHLSYFQVDNPLVYCIDPLFMGLHDLTGSEMSSKTVSKAGPVEKVGNFVFADGAVQVIEYSDLPESLARQTAADGSLLFNAGSIAIHALRVSFVGRLNEGGELQLPWHRAEKKVAYIDAAGTMVKPDKPNAVKLEQFVFDAIPLARNAIVYETDRAEEFSPVKNADGSDSPATCRRDQIRRAARWLRTAGVEVANLPDGEPNATLEISPLYAKTADDLKSHDDLPKQIGPGAAAYFGAKGIEGA